MTDEELQEMIDEADRDGDGEINEEEVRTTQANHTSPQPPSRSHHPPPHSPLSPLTLVPSDPLPPPTVPPHHEEDLAVLDANGQLRETNEETEREREDSVVEKVDGGNGPARGGGKWRERGDEKRHGVGESGRQTV